MLDERMQRTTIDGRDWSRGVANAPIILLEYGDMECPYCAAARPVLESLVFENPEALRLVFRHFPVTSIHPHALLAAEAAEAAGAQGSFWEMHDILLSRQQRLELDDLLSYAGELDLDLERYERELRAHSHLPEVRADFRRGIQDGVNGTPTIFINGLRYDGVRDRQSMLSAIVTQTRAVAQDQGTTPG